MDLFEEELREERQQKKKLSREKRSLQLIANFNKDDYADGWFFAVKKAFRDELDIKETERKESVFDDDGTQVYRYLKNKNGDVLYNKNGTPKKRKKTKAVMRWTQGKNFCFAEGHLIYYADNPDMACQVIRAIPSQSKPNGEFQKGNVTFILIKFLNGTYSHTIGQYNLTQKQFIEYLKTGDLDHCVISE